MKSKIISFVAFLFLMTAIVSCDTLKTLPTNTTGGLFSLNGGWRLAATSDGTSMVGSRITVSPIIGNGTIKLLANNTYCMSEGDALWQSVKSNGAGGFTVSLLVNACNGTTIYKSATITVVNNDRITLNGTTADNRELVQQWNRLNNN